MQSNNFTEYDRYLSPIDVLAIAFGCTVGWSAFVLPGTMFLPLGGPVGTLASMAISAAIMLIIGANFSYLMTNRPGTGGMYAYTKEAFGREHAFFCAWFLSLAYLTILFINATSLFSVIRLIFSRRLQIGFYSYQIGGNVIFLGEVAASFVVLAGIGLLFINAKPFLQQVQTKLAIVLLLGVLLLAAISLPTSIEKFAGSGAFGISGESRPSNLFSLVMLTPGLFVGFEVISLETAHFDFQMKKSKWIAMVSILLCAVIYLALTIIGMRTAPDGYASWQAYIADLGNLDGFASVPTFYSAKGIMGDAGILIMALAAFAAILTSIIAGYRATTRMLATMAEDNIISEHLSNTNYSIVAIMVVCIAISFFGSHMLEDFTELTFLGAVICFGYTSASAWKLAKEKGNWMYVITGVIGIVVSVMFAIVKLVPWLPSVNPMGANAFLLLTVWCLLGFMFHLRTLARSSAGVYSGSSLSGIMMFALLLFSVLMWLGKRLLEAESIEMVKSILRYEGGLMLIVIFIGLGIMLYIQKLTQKKHEELLKETVLHFKDDGE